LLASLVGLVNSFTGKNCFSHVSTKVGSKTVYYILQRILRSYTNITTHNVLSLFTDFGHVLRTDRRDGNEITGEWDPSTSSGYSSFQWPSSLITN